MSEPSGDDRERAIAEIANAARAARDKPSRTMWIAAALIGALGLGGFLAIMLAEGTRPSSTTPPSHDAGFATGLAIGIAAGIAIGFAIARRYSRPHSDRSSP